VSAAQPAVKLSSVALAGLGEAGALLAAGFAQAGLQVRAYDIKLHDAAQAAAMRERAQACGARLCDTLAQAIEGADLIVSAVTANCATEAAVAAAAHMRPGQFFLDINSVSPATKIQDRDAIAGAQGHYVEAAVMAPVPPYGIKVPMLLGGERALDLSDALNALGLRTQAVATEIGVASAIKMCRSVMIKGIEALTVECLSAARRYGAEQAVLASLNETFPSMGWLDKQPHYLISRVAEHGRRRAAEMREVMQTLQDAGVQPRMSEATARAQDAFIDAMQERGLTYPHGEDFDWRAFTDKLR
jgi:3-hydroxyisobutyrate dehydrogenase-like beta-hydroxyacid dehydrogenase